MRNILALSLIIALSGCSVTSYDLKRNPSGQIHYELNENYQTVYRRIIQGSKYCYESGTRRVSSFIYPDTKTAEIDVAIVYGGSVRTLYFIEVTGVSDNQTSVTGYYSYNISQSWKKGVEDSKQWAGGSLKACRYRKP